MHDRILDSEHFPTLDGAGKHEWPQWVRKYLELADIALDQQGDDWEYQSAA